MELTADDRTTGNDGGNISLLTSAKKHYDNAKSKRDNAHVVIENTRKAVNCAEEEYKRAEVALKRARKDHEDSLTLGEIANTEYMAAELYLEHVKKQQQTSTNKKRKVENDTVVDDSYECPICREELEDGSSGSKTATVPVTGKCGHTICKPCLTKLHNSALEGRSRVRNLKCPCCQNKVAFDAQELSINILICKMISSKQKERASITNNCQSSDRAYSDSRSKNGKVDSNISNDSEIVANFDQPCIFEEHDSNGESNDRSDSHSSYDSPIDADSGSDSDANDSDASNDSPTEMGNDLDSEKDGEDYNIISNDISTNNLLYHQDNVAEFIENLPQLSQFFLCVALAFSKVWKFRTRSSFSHYCDNTIFSYQFMEDFDLDYRSQLFRLPRNHERVDIFEKFRKDCKEILCFQHSTKTGNYWYCGYYSLKYEIRWKTKLQDVENAFCRNVTNKELLQKIEDYFYKRVSK